MVQIFRCPVRDELSTIRPLWEPCRIEVTRIAVGDRFERDLLIELYGDSFERLPDVEHCTDHEPTIGRNVASAYSPTLSSRERPGRCPGRATRDPGRGCPDWLHKTIRGHQDSAPEKPPARRANDRFESAIRNRRTKISVPSVLPPIAP